MPPKKNRKKIPLPYFDNLVSNLEPIDYSSTLEFTGDPNTNKTNKNKKKKKQENIVRKERIRVLEQLLSSNVQEAVESDENSFAAVESDPWRPSRFLYRFVSEGEYLVILENLNQGTGIFCNKRKTIDEDVEEQSTLAKGETFFAFDYKYAQNYFNKGTRRNGVMLVLELHEDADSKLLSNNEIIRRIGNEPGMACGRWSKCKKVKKGERGVVVVKCEGVGTGKYPYTLGFRDGGEEMNPFDVLFSVTRTLKVLSDEGSSKTLYHYLVEAPLDKETVPVTAKVSRLEEADNVPLDESLVKSADVRPDRYSFFATNKEEIKTGVNNSSLKINLQ